MKKKGISPLIATVLLIGFTVALVLVVTTWGMDYIKDLLSSTKESSDIAMKCAPPYLEFDVREDCNSGKFTIMNRGINSIMKFKIIPSDGEPTELGTNEEPLNLESGDVTSAETMLTVKAEIIAYIAGDSGEMIPCAQAVQEIRVCPPLATEEV